MTALRTTAVVAAVQLALVGAAVAPQLSARTTGETYVLRVSPLDPIEPYRGAYVALDYPDLQADRVAETDDPFGQTTVYVRLRREGSVWVADGRTRSRPQHMPYLTCDVSWRLRCGIESWFVPQSEAASVAEELADGAYAELRVDGRGHAALVDLRERP